MGVLVALVDPVALAVMALTPSLATLMVRLAVLVEQAVLAVSVVWAVSVVPQLVASEALMELMRLVALVVPAVMGALEVMDQQALMV